MANTKHGHLVRKGGITLDPMIGRIDYMELDREEDQEQPGYIHK